MAPLDGRLRRCPRHFRCGLQRVQEGIENCDEGRRAQDRGRKNVMRMWTDGQRLEWIWAGARRHAPCPQDRFRPGLYLLEGVVIFFLCDGEPGRKGNERGRMRGRVFLTVCNQTASSCKSEAHARVRPRDSWLALDGYKPYPITGFLQTWTNADYFHSLTTFY